VFLVAPAPRDYTSPMPERFTVYVQPRAARTQVAGMHDGCVKVRLAAPPVDGAANAELIAFVAGKLDVPKSRVHLVAGETSRRKTLSVDGVDAAAALAALLA
jgi:uncharacterized protein (TIGR00251 family)